MRRFLYITPYFPPLTHVGALRPLKFALHLPEFGWTPVVLADLHPGDAMSRDLAEAVPRGTAVVRDYSSEAAATEAAFLRGELPRPTHDAGGKPIRPDLGWKRMLPRALRNEYQSRSFWFPDQTVLPLGHHLLDVRHGVKAALRALEAHPGCEAIVVNSDPAAVLLVGKKVAAETGLPLVCDLRDPWALCTLKRAQTPAPQLRLVEWIERGVVEASARFVLNTETALADYRAHYADLPQERFDFIRNHGDPGLIGGGVTEPRSVFSALFLGNFRKYVEGDVLMRALALLKARGIGADRFRFVITGRVVDRARDLARDLGVEDMFEEHPFVPYLNIGPFMQSMDLLVALNNATLQRVPAKLYDYLTTDRPTLVLADSPEIERMVGGLDGVWLRGLNDAEGAADVMQTAFEAGRQRHYDRASAGFDSRTASAKLASILDDVTRTA